MSYDNDNEAAVWGNEDRKTDKHPHFKGSATIAGVEYWVSAWKRDAGANPKAPSLKLKFTPKDKQDEPTVPREQAGGDFDDSDSIPF